MSPRQRSPEELATEVDGWRRAITVGKHGRFWCVVAMSVWAITHRGGIYRFLDIRTPTQHVQISVSPTGRSVRIFVDGIEVPPRS